MSEICAIIVCRLYLNFTIFKNACRIAPKDLSIHWRSTPWNPGSLPSRGPAPCRPYRRVDLPLTQTWKSLLPRFFSLKIFWYKLSAPLVISFLISKCTPKLICFIVSLVNLFLVTLGLHGCSWAFPSCEGQRLLASWDVRASHCGGFLCRGARALGHRLNSRGARASLLHSMEDLPRSGIKPVSPASVGGFFTTEPPGKPSSLYV